MAAKKSSRKAANTKKDEPVVNSKPKKLDLKASKNLMSNKRFFAVLVGIIVIGLLYYFKGLFVAATVNNKPIFRPLVVKELEKQYGQDTLDSLITESLINQEAVKNNIVVSQDDIDSQIKEIEDNLKAQGQDLDSALKLRGMTKDDLTKQIKIQKMVEQLLADKISVTDDEINKYIEDNQSSLPENLTGDDLKNTVKTQLTQQKLSTEFQTWITDLKSKAKINYFVSY